MADYSGSYSYITLTSIDATIDATGTVNDTTANGIAVYGSKYSSNVIDLTNEGIIASSGGATSAGGIGVDLLGHASAGFGRNYYNILTNGTNASITGNLIGVEIGSATEGTLGLGSVINDGYIGSNGTAVLLPDSGRVYNASIGTIKATGAGSFGVFAVGTAVAAGVINAGYIGATGTAIFFHDGGTISNLAQGVISSTGDGGIGVLFVGSGSIDNRGLIKAEGSGGLAVSDNGAVMTSGGTIESNGSAGLGVEISGGGQITNQFTIVYKGIGVYATYTGLISANGTDGRAVVLDAGGTVTNQAVIEAIGSGGIGVSLTAGGTVHNTSATTSVIAGDAAGVAGANGYVQNYGTIEATGASGIGVDMTGATGSVVNQSSIIATGTAGIGIRLENGAFADNFGTIQSADIGVYLDGRLVNRNLIESTQIDGIGVEATTGAYVENTGLIEAAGTGVGLSGDSTITNYAGTSGIGTIEVTLAAGVGVATTNSTITNEGTILASGAASQGVDMAGTSVLNNEGLIRAGAVGVSASGGTITNYGFGTIDATGATGIGVELTGTVLVNNRYLIEGTAYGIEITGSGGTVVNYNVGTITGAIGVYVSGATSGTVENNGLIQSTAGAAGDAVKFGSGNDLLELAAGARFTGLVQGGGLDSTLELRPTARGAYGTLTGLGSEYTGFGIIQVDAGAVWSIANAATIASSYSLNVLAGGTLVDQGSLGVQGTINNAGSLQSAHYLSLSSTGVLDNSGYLAAGAGAITLQGGGTVTNTGTLVDNGAGATSIQSSFTQGTAGTLSINGGRFELDQATGGPLTGALDGTIEGTGTLFLNAGTDSLAASLSLTVADLYINETDIVLGGDLTFNGVLQEQLGSTIALGSYTLTLTGTDSLSGLIGGTGLASSAGTINASGTLSLDGATLGSGVVLDNTGTITQTAAFTIDGSAKLANTGTLNITGDDWIAGTGVLQNSGLLEKTGGGGLSRIYASLNNLSTVYAGSGTLQLFNSITNTGIFTVGTSGALEFRGGGSSNADDFTVASGGTLDFQLGDFVMSGGTFDVAGGSLRVGTYGGTLDLSQASITAAGGLGAKVDLYGVTGLLNLGTNSVTIATMTEGGDFLLEGSGIVTVGSLSVSLRGGQDGTGTTVLTGYSTISQSMDLDQGRTVENKGSMVIGGSAYIILGGEPVTNIPNQGDATLTNDAGATVNFTGDGRVDTYTAAGTHIINNAGLFEKTGGAGRSAIQVTFNNTGTVAVDTGTISFGQMVTNSGHLAVANGATLEFRGGGSSNADDITAASGATLNFRGGDFVMNGGTFDVAGATTKVGQYGGSLDLSNASIAASGGLGAEVDLYGVTGLLNLGTNSVTIATLTEGGDFLLEGSGVVTVGSLAISLRGGQDGTGTTVLTGYSTISQSMALDQGRTVENKGSMVIGGSAYIILGGEPVTNIPSQGDATLTNDAGATVNFTGDGRVDTYTAAGTHIINNAGLFEKTGGAGRSLIAVDFTNTSTGTIAVQTGTFDFTGGGLFNGTVEGAGTVEFGGGVQTLGAGLTLSVANLNLYGGTVALGADVSFGNTITDGAGAYLDLGSHTLSLSGTSYLDGKVGHGVLTNSGVLTTGASFRVGGTNGATLINSGTIESAAGTTGVAVQFGTGSNELVLSSGAYFVGTVAGGSGVNTLELTGTGTLNGFGSKYTGFQVLDVAAGGTWTIAGTTTLGAGTTLVNDGTVTLGAADTLTLSGVVTNDGVLDAGAGTLALASADIVGGTLEASGGGTIVVTGTTTLDPAGTITVDGLVVVDGTLVTQGVVAGAASFDLNGGTVTNQGTLQIGGAGITLAGTGELINQAGGTIDLLGNGTYAIAIANAGVLDKTGGAYTSFGGSFTNTGTVEADSGTIGFAGAFVGGGFIAGPGGTMVFKAGGTAAGTGSTIAAGGTADFAGGAFTITGGALTLGGALSIYNSTSLDLSGVTLVGTTASVSLVQYGILELGANALTIASLNQHNTTIDGTGTLTVTGATTLYGAVHSGAGDTVLEGPTTLTGELTLEGGRTLDNQGALTLSGNFFAINVGPAGTGGTVLNHGTIDFAGENGITGGTSAASFVNYGLLDKTFGSNVSSVGIALTNNGTIEADTGTLGLYGAVNNLGALSASSGGTLLFKGGGTSDGAAFTVAAGGALDFYGASTFTMTGGPLNVGGSTTVDNVAVLDVSGISVTSIGTVLSLVNGGTLELGANSVTLTSLTENASVLNGTGTVTVTGATTINNSAEETGTGRTVLEGPTTMFGALNLEGGRTLDNQGALTLSGNFFSINIGPAGTGGTLVNHGTIDFAGENGITGGASAASFVNYGLLDKTFGSGNVSSIGIAFTNHGTIEADTGTVGLYGAVNNLGVFSASSGGTLLFKGGGTSDGAAFTVAAGGALDFYGASTFTMTGGPLNVGGSTTVDDVAVLDVSGISVTSIGTVLSLVNGGTLELGANSVTLTSLTENASVLNGTGTVTVTGATSILNSAEELGTGRTVLEGPTTMFGALNLEGGRTLDNQGALTLSGNFFAINVGPSGTGGTLLNHGTIDFAGESGISVGTGAASFVNYGLVDKTFGSGNVSSIGGVTNHGTIKADVGTIGLYGAVDNTGVLLANSGATVLLAPNGGGTVTNTGTFQTTGTGVITFGGGGNVLRVGAGADFAANVDGGSGANTIELLASVGVPGTLDGLGTTLTNFSVIDIDPNAKWTLGGISTIGNGVTVVNSGTLTADGTLALTGTLTGTGTLQFGGGNDLLQLAGTAIFSDAIDGGAGANTLELLTGPGTLAGLGSTITNFGLVEVDAGGAWTLKGVDTVTSLTDAGTLTIAGTLVNNGDFDVTGSLVNQGLLDGSASYRGLVHITSGGFTNYGNVLSTANNAFAVLDLGTGQISNAAGGTISATGTNSTAISTGGNLINAGAIAGGVGLTADGTVTNLTGGVISGGYGLFLAAGGYVTNQAGGTISGSNIAGGVHITGGAGTVVNRGVIGPSGTVGGGVLLHDGGTVDNFGSISGSGKVVELDSGGTVVNEAGAVISGLTGLYSTGTAAIDVTNDGAISVSFIGINLSSGTIDNTGTIQASGAYGRGIDIEAGAVFVINAVSGLITAGGKDATAIDVGATGTVSNLGAVSATGTGGTGILSAGAYIDNSGTVTADGAAIVSAGTVVNSGKLGGAYGVLLTAAGAVTNQSGGTITGAAVKGVQLDDGGSILNQAAATITGAGGVNIAGTAGQTGTLDNLGSIASAGGDAGVKLGIFGTVTNQGQIQAVGGFAAILLDAGGTVVNDSQILSNGSYGFGVYLNAGGTVTNAAAGTISAGGTRGEAVVLHSGGTLTNHGLIDATGTHGYGVAVLAAGNITNDGTIDGATGMRFFGTAGNTLTNAGLIESTSASGFAVAFGSGASDLVLDPTGKFVGIVDGGGSLGTLELAAGTGAISGLGTQFVHFGAVDIDVGASWTFDSTDTIVGGTTLLNQGTLDTTGTLEIAGSLGGSGTVQFTGSGNELLLDGGAAVSGTITSAGSHNEIVLAAGTGSLTGFGTNIRNFDTIDVRAGGVWTLAGITTISAATDLINSGTVLVNGELDVIGTVDNTGGTVLFGTGADTLVLTPGATFTGGFDGGTGSFNTLELAAGTSTLNGLGTAYAHFQDVTIAANGHWTFSGSNTVATGGTLVDDGNLTLTGLLVNDADLQVTGAFSNQGTIEGSLAGGSAVHVTSGTFDNAGSVLTSEGLGIRVDGGGLVSNAATGTISTTGVNAAAIQSNGNVVNAGLIEAAAYGLELVASGTVSNLSGGVVTADYAVRMAAGGYLTNAAAGTISGATLAVNIYGAAGTITNRGLIGPAGGTGGGVVLGSGGVVDNFGTIAAAKTAIILSNGGTATNEGAASITGDAGISVTAGVADVANAGTITATSLGIALGGGGSVDNSGKITVSNDGAQGINVYAGTAAVTNTGSGIVDASGAGTAVVLGAAGSLVNSGLLEAGTNGIAVKSAGAYVDNTGTITAGHAGIISSGTVVNSGNITGNYGVQITAAAAVTNQSGGSITGSVDYGVDLFDGGSVVNQAGATITGAAAAINILGTAGQTGTVDNLGTIQSIAGNGIDLSVLGTVTNSGLIEGVVGIDFSGTAGNTLINFGTIKGTNPNGDAVRFGTGPSLLILEPNASFVGAVDGGGSLGTLELASGNGTLSGLGTQFVHFGVVDIDNGATWTFDSTDTIVSGTTLLNHGTLAASGTFEVAGALRSVGGGKVQFDNGPSVLLVEAGASFTGAVDGGGGANTIELAAGAGTLTGFGTNLTKFSVIDVVAGGTWTLGGVSTIGAGTTLENAGTVKVNGKLDVIGSIDNTGGTLAFGTGADTLELNPGAYISGRVDGGTGAANTLELAAGTGSVAGFGTGIVNFQVVDIDAGGTWTLAGLDTIATGTTIENAGVLLASGTLEIAGTLDSTGDGAVQFTGSDNRLILDGGASFSGAINGGGLDNTIELGTGIGTLTGFGAGITNFSKIAVDAGGTWTLAGTTTIGTGEAIENDGSLTVSGTLDVLGTLDDTGGTLTFGTGDNLLILNPGASLSGPIDGSQGANTLELAAGYGTLNDFGTSVTGFPAVRIDAGGDWILTGASTVAAGETVTNDGTLRVGTGASLDNSGTISATADHGTAISLDGGAQLTNGGTIQATGTQTFGIDATGGGTLANTGIIAADGFGAFGIYSAGSLYISNAATGSIVATGTGASGVHLGAGGTLFNQGLISAGGDGVVGQSGNLILNVGSIVGTGSASALVDVYNGGTLINSGYIGAATAAIGVDVSNSKLSNSGTIAVSGNGVDLLLGGSIGNTGTIQSTNAGFAGVAVFAAGTVNNSGKVLSEGANGFGVFLNAGGLVVNHSYVGATGTAGDAIALYNGGTVTNTGRVEATGSSSIGIFSKNGGAAALIANNGTIEATGNQGIGVKLASQTNLTNNAHATIEATGTKGVAVNLADGRLINSGTVDAAGQNGIAVQTTSGSVTNSGSGVIEATGSLSFAIQAYAPTTITNAASAAIIGTNVAINLGHGGAVVNYGSIGGRYGIASFYAPTITNALGATITGTQVAIQLSAGGTLTNDGSIASGGLGIVLLSGGSIDNAGVIQGEIYLAHGGYVFNSGTTGSVDLGTGSSLVNRGAIQATGYRAAGVAVRSGASFTNTGTVAVSGSVAYAVALLGTGSFTNALGGTVTSNGTAAIGIKLTVGGTLANYGAITASGTGIYGYSANVVENFASGTIAATGSLGFGVVGASTVLNSGTIEGATAGGGGSYNPGGIYLNAGGFVSNASGGFIYGSQIGIKAANGAGTIENAGTIKVLGQTGNAAVGILLDAGGTILNTGTIEDTGPRDNAVRILNGGAFLNYGLIEGAAADEAFAVVAFGAAISTVAAGGTVSVAGLGGTGFFQVSGSLDNAGLIEEAGQYQRVGYGVAVYSKTAAITNTGSLVATGVGGIGAQILGGSLTNAAAGRIESSGTSGIGLDLQGGVASNLGTIQAAGSGGIAVRTSAGGTLTNAGYLGGIAGGVLVTAGGSVGNSGTIEASGTDGAGVYLTAGGTVTNTGLIEATSSSGVGVYAHGGSVANSGVVRGGNIGVEAYGGVVTDLAGGTIEGVTGIVFVDGLGTTASPVTLETAGTIEGTGGVAVQFGAGDDLLKVDAGASFTGRVDGGGGINTLELAAGSGTLGYLGTSFTQFGVVEVDGGGQWMLTGANLLAGTVSLTDAGDLTVTGSLTNDGTITVAGGSLTDQTALAGYGTIEIANHGSVHLVSGASGGTIAFADATGTLTLDDATGFSMTLAGFVQGDTLDLTGISYSTEDSATLADDTLLVEQNGTFVAEFTMTGLPDGATFAVESDGHGGTDIVETSDNSSGGEAACYCAGTRIWTARGDIPVEDLQIGDLVATLAGAFRPIRWIGTRSYDPARIEIGRDTILPIVIQAGALSPGVPERDLAVSPEHCFYLAGALIPARFLVNGASITRRRTLDPVTYFHIELDAHEVIYAEGALAESYRENAGNRAMFENGADIASREIAPCAPLVWDGPVLTEIRQALRLQAETLAFGTTLDPDLHLLVDGVPVRATSSDGSVYRFELDRPARDIRLVSRSAVPAETGDAPDHRRLGINLERLVLQSPTLRIEIGHGAPSLTDGFHADEPTHRWTNGDAAIPERFLECFGSALTIEVHTLGVGLAYSSNGSSVRPEVADDVGLLPADSNARNV